MRVLFAIPHYVGQVGDAAMHERKHGSVAGGTEGRAQALIACVTALQQLFRTTHWTIDHGRRIASDAPSLVPHEIAVVICTTQGRHVLDGLGVAARHFSHHPTAAAPELLGFACHDVLCARLGHYDYYCYLEDDLVLHDPWFFIKLAWFSAQAGEDKLLQPNRFEAGLGHLVPKVYVDGNLAEGVTQPFQDVRDTPPIPLEAMGQRVVFERTLNPHSGCFFLNARQMEHWSRQAHFRDRESRLLGPLETAATLGILRTFKVYKPALSNADFLEVQHHGTGYIERLCPPPAAGELP